MNDVEVWKDIKGYEGLYQVSNKGRVKSMDRYANNNGTLQFRPERILKQRIEKAGRSKRCAVVLCKNAKTKTIKVHLNKKKTFRSKNGASILGIRYIKRRTYEKW